MIPVGQYASGWLATGYSSPLFLSHACMPFSLLQQCKCKQPSTAFVHAYMFDSILSTYLSVSVQARLSCGCLCESLLSRITSFLVLLPVVLVLPCPAGQPSLVVVPP